jgi:hypothetical protein
MSALDGTVLTDIDIARQAAAGQPSVQRQGMEYIVEGYAIARLVCKRLGVRVNRPLRQFRY